MILIQPRIVIGKKKKKMLVKTNSAILFASLDSLFTPAFRPVRLAEI